ncbi:unnamed protein product [Polarella glacialis]|uniref:Uncharacterized protein n=1 Tax=Polarella glacialis TaxID=89957 RepID=A0A813FIW1_POLGL|nr:unnamed protein product [Polarella glacialis]
MADSSPFDGTARAADKDKDDKEKWLGSLELESLLMNTVKEADHGATFLRRLLQMNPAYGAYLAEDKDIAGIVQLFAKRLRAKILHCQAMSSPVTPESFYESLCEMTWRVVGNVLHGIIDLEDTTGLPLPKEPIGQVRMLMQTNMELSNKLNSMRRDYLRELSFHRDKQRNISENAQMALASLQEYPVMFFEPLDSVLDDASKEFIKAVVEERVKLGMKGPPRKIEVIEEVEPVHFEHDNDAEISKVMGELRQSRGALAREQELRKRDNQQHEAAEAKLKEQLDELMSGGEGPSMEELFALREELRQKHEALAEYEKATGSGDDAKMSILEKKIATGKASLDEASQTIKDFEEELQKCSLELEATREKMKKCEQKLASQGEEMKELQKNPGKGDKAPNEVVKTQVVSDDKALAEQMERHLDIEKELRGANRALEKALEEERAKRSLTTNSGADIIGNIPSGADKDVKEAIAKMSKQFEKKIKEQEAEIARLREELAGSTGGGVKKARPVKEVADAGDQEDWKAKCSQFEDEKEDLQHEVDKQAQQIGILIDKLRQLGGDAAVQEVAHRIKLTAPPPKKQRKKKAFERLYEDAQRRIIKVRMLADKLKTEQDDILRHAMKSIRNTKSLRYMQNVVHLKTAADATQNRFSDALSKFNDENPEAAPMKDAGAQGRRPSNWNLVRDFGDSGDQGDSASRSQSPTRTRADLKPIDTSDAAAVRAEIGRLHDNNDSLREEVERLRQIMAAAPSSTQLTDSGMQVLGQRVASPSRGSISSAQGSLGRNRSQSIAELDPRSESPHRASGSQRLLVPPSPAREPPARYSGGGGMDGLIQSRALNSESSKPQTPQAAGRIPRARTDGNFGQESRLSDAAHPSQSSLVGAKFSPSSSSMGGMPARQSPLAQSEARLQLESEPPWRRQPQTRPQIAASDAPAGRRLGPAPLSSPLAASASAPTLPRPVMAESPMESMAGDRVAVAQQLLNSVGSSGGPSFGAGAKPSPAWRRAGTPTELSIDGGNRSPKGFEHRQLLGQGIDGGPGSNTPIPPSRNVGNFHNPPTPMGAGPGSRSPGPAPGSLVPGRSPVVGSLDPLPLKVRVLEPALNVRVLELRSPRRLTERKSPSPTRVVPQETLKPLSRSLPAAELRAQLAPSTQGRGREPLRELGPPESDRKPRVLKGAANDWDNVPVKPLPPNMCVTALRSQASLSELSRQPPAM